MNQKTLEDVIKTVRVAVVADVCGVSQRAIYKWMDNGKLPRTEYTGETNYAEKNRSCIKRIIFCRCNFNYWQE